MSSRALLSASAVLDEEDDDWHHFVNWDISPFKDIASIAYTACLSGPVDVHKQHTWRGVTGFFSIADKFKEAGYPMLITNVKWKKFCKAVSHNIDCRSLAVRRRSYTFRKYGKLWPDCDAEYVSDQLSLVIKHIEINHYGASRQLFMAFGHW